MCGLAGCIATDAGAPERIRAMLGRLRHRGPDGEGMLTRTQAGRSIVLGHRRLSIIDLTPAASQPMTSADGRLHLILNGEIYNYLELRSDLERLGKRFRTRSDTEVLLEAWAAWGSETLQRVVGMFAFALLDEQVGTLVLARDPFAIKPLYYATLPGQLWFASEIPPLLDVPGVSRQADAGAVADFLTRGVNNHEGRTMFAGVREIPGAHFAEIPLAGPLTMEPERYWTPPSSLVHDISFPEAVDRFRALFEASVRLHLRSDVPVGMLLSGGQDSSSVLAMSRKVLGPKAELHTFSYRGEAGAADEGRWIEAARTATGAIGHDIRLTPDDWARDLSALIAAQAEPFSSPVIYAQRRLFQCAAECGVKVVLDGQGSDEYLAGYDRYYTGYLASLLHRGRYLAFASTAVGYGLGGEGWKSPAGSAVRMRWPALRPAPSVSGDRLLDDGWLEGRGAAVSPLWTPRRPDVLREMLGVSLRVPSIPWLMRYADRNAMAFSIENRVPFLNAPLVEFALGLPEDYFISATGKGKHLLRSAMRGLVPDVIRHRRDKIGFDVPVEAWLPRTPGLEELIEASLEIPAVRKEPARRLLEAIRTKTPLPRPRAFEAWRLVTLAAWQREFGVAFH